MGQKLLTTLLEEEPDQFRQRKEGAPFLLLLQGRELIFDTKNQLANK